MFLFIVNLVGLHCVALFQIAHTEELWQIPAILRSKKTVAHNLSSSVMTNCFSHPPIFKLYREKEGIRAPVRLGGVTSKLF